MAEAKTCPKCNGTMTQGRVMKYNDFSTGYIYVFAPDDEPGPDLSKLLSGKPLSGSRKALVAFACDQCGFTEFYAQTSE